MAKKKTTTSWPAQTEQRRFAVPGVDTSRTTAIPRDTEFDLVQESSRTRYASDEQTFRVTKKGNRP